LTLDEKTGNIEENSSNELPCTETRELINTFTNAVPMPYYQDRGSDRQVVNGMGRTYVNPNMVGE
jgi:hypothetical protein